MLLEHEKELPVIQNEIAMNTAQRLQVTYIRPALQLKPSKVLPESITLNRSGLMSLYESVYMLKEGSHQIQFPYVHDGEEMEVSAKIWIDDAGIWMYQNFIATAEDGREYEIQFNAFEFNKEYL